MNADLPIDLLRSFVAIVEAGTVRMAADLMHRTPPALSLQMSRLEEAAGVALFRKSGRGLKLTEAGETLLPLAVDLLARHDAVRSALRSAVSAGPARLGLVQDFAGHLLAHVMNQVRRKHEDAPLSVTIGNSMELAALLANNEVDVMVAHAPGKGHDIARLRCPAVWLGNKAFALRERVPLVLVSTPCPYAELAISALEAAGRSYEVVMRTPSLEGMQAAVAGGLGIGCRNKLVAGKTVPVIAAGRLPPLSEIVYSVRCRSSLGPAAKTLAEETKSAVERLKL